MQISSLTQSDNLKNLLGGFSASSTAAVTEAKKDEAYTLDISDEAYRLSATQSQINRATNPSLNKALPSDLQNSIDDVQTKMSRILLAHNIRTDTEYNLTVNDEGRIELIGNYPDKEAIENALNSDSEFVNEVTATLNKVSSEAQAQLNDKKDIRLKEHEEDDEEEKKKQNELERQMSIKARAVSVSQQISAVSNNFSFNNGSISFASLDIAQGAIF